MMKVSSLSVVEIIEEKHLYHMTKDQFPKLIGEK